MKKTFLIIATIFLTACNFNEPQQNMLYTEITDDALFLYCHNTTSHIIDSATVTVEFYQHKEFYDSTVIDDWYNMSSNSIVDSTEIIDTVIHGPIFDGDIVKMKLRNMYHTQYDTNVITTAKIINKKIYFYN